MWKNKKVWLKSFSCLLMGLSVFMGYSCSDDKPEVMDPEHDMPYAKYTLQGKVMNEKREGVPDIQLIICEVYRDTYSEDQYVPDTFYTDMQGRFLYINENAFPNNMLRVIYKSVDPSGRVGIYKTDSTTVDMGELKNPSAPWYEGEAFKQIEIILEEKKTGEEGTD